MRPLTLAQIAQAVGGAVSCGADTTLALSVCHDTRVLDPGALFVALPGEQVDGHRFVATALARGASGAIVSHEVDALGPMIRVEDTTMALALLSRWYLSTLSCDTLAVTGSVGKTTVREMITRILDRMGATVSAKGNHNTEIGVPMTVLRADDGTDYLVLEFGMRGPGQIAHLVNAAPPRVAVITNIGITHAEILGSRDAIAHAKAELLDGLGQDTIAVLPAEDDYADFLVARAPDRIISFGLRRGDVRAERRSAEGGHGFAMPLSLDLAGSRHLVSLQCLGRHNVVNAACAAAAGLAMGASPAAIVGGLETYEPMSGRGRLLQSPSGLRIIDDTYNASPASMVAALEVLSECSGPRVALLGDMLELGEFAAKGHHDVGAAAARAGLDALVTMGDLARGIHEGALGAGLAATCAYHFNTRDEAAEALPSLTPAAAVVLVKASRGVASEAVVARLMEN